MRDKRKKLICLILMASALTGVTSNTSVTAFSNSNSNSNRLVKLISLAGLGFLAPLVVYLTYSGYKSSLVSENSKQESGREHEQENNSYFNNKDEEQITQKTVSEHDLRNSVVRSPIVLAIFLILSAVTYLFVRYYAKSNIFLFVKYKPPNDNKGYKEINLKGTTAYLKFKDDEENKLDHKDDTIILSFQGSSGSGIDGIDLCKSKDEKFIKSVASVT